METNEIAARSLPGTPEQPQQIASWAHFVGFLAIMAAVGFMGWRAQQAGSQNSGGASAGQLASHSQAIYMYLVAAVMDWALLYYCWVGAHRLGLTLRSLSGGRWNSWKDLGQDLAIALPFWAIWEGAAYGTHKLLGPSSAKSVDSLLPHSLLEVMVWIGVCVTAGFCEEIAFRGYLQKQCHALLGNLSAAIVAQALIFGVAHSYQGWKNVVVISVLGVLYGALAAWRKNLRANMMSHAWSDVWEGWFKFVVWR
jgi:membrane protease YdiL (CAAX protease family)